MELVVALVSWASHVSHPTFESSARYSVGPTMADVAAATLERSLAESGARNWSIAKVEEFWPAQSWPAQRDQTIRQRFDEFVRRMRYGMPIHYFLLTVEDSDPVRATAMTAKAVAESESQVRLLAEKEWQAKCDKLAAEIESLRKAGKNAVADSMELMFIASPEDPFRKDEPSKGREIITIREPLAQSAILAAAILVTIVSYIAVRGKTAQPKLIPV
jgi:hypothetical protein